MKVAVFSRYPKDSGKPKGGVESVTVVLVRALAELQGMDVHVITLENSLDKVAVEQDGLVTVHRLPKSRCPQVFDIIAGPGKKKLVNYINRLKPDVLHTHETYGLGLGKISLPHVFTVHGFDHTNLIADSARFAWLRSKLWKRVELKGLANQKHIISISPYVKAMIEPCTKANIYEIDNPVDERFYNIERCVEPGRVLCVGWLNERKNTLGSIEAFDIIAKQYPDAKLIIAGQAQEQEYFDRVKQKIAQYKLENRIELLGHINHTQLKDEMSKACVFLLPSRQENSPMAIAEAMAASVPVIAANRCGMPFMVKEGETGFLIDPESTEQIADRLGRLVGSINLCEKMGAAGRREAKRRFHLHEVALKTKEVYQRISKNI